MGLTNQKIRIDNQLKNVREHVDGLRVSMYVMGDTLTIDRHTQDDGSLTPGERKRAHAILTRIKQLTEAMLEFDAMRSS